MTMRMYVIRDRYTRFGFPMPFESNDEAKRYFANRIKEVPLMRDNPQDFTLYYVGIFNLDTGTITPTEEPILIEGHYMPLEEEEVTTIGNEER